MEGLPRSTSIRRLPQAVTATLAVVGVPLVAVSLLRASGILTGVLPLVAAGMALSLAASYVGGAIWATRPGAGDTLFGDLMLWGWLRRWRAERQLASVVRTLGLREARVDLPLEMSPDRRVRLLTRLGASLEARCPDTHGHSRRVARHAAAIARRMGLAPEEVARIRTAASVHDVGKVYIPGEIVDKPGALTDAEFAVVKQHAEIGAGMVSGLGDEELTRIVRHHHERIDGKGYPAGLAGDEIPLGARIIAVADTFDAITSTRPYRSARRHRDALGVLAEEAGTQLDPAAVRAFRGYYSGLRAVALWALVLNGPRQLLASLGSELRLGNVVVAAKATAATAATVVAGSAAVHAVDAVNRAPQGVAATEPSAGRLVASPTSAGINRAQQPGDSSKPDKSQSSPGRSPDAEDSIDTRADSPLDPPIGGESTPDSGSGASQDGHGGSDASDSGEDGPGSSGSAEDEARPTLASAVRDAPPKGVASARESVTSTVDSVETTVTNTVAETTREVESALPNEVGSALPDLPTDGL